MHRPGHYLRRELTTGEDQAALRITSNASRSCSKATISSVSASSTLTFQLPSYCLPVFRIGRIGESLPSHSDPWGKSVDPRARRTCDFSFKFTPGQFIDITLLNLP